MKRTHLTVANELVLKRELDLARGDAMLLGDSLKLVDDRDEDPGENMVDGSGIDGRGIEENVVDEVVALQGEHVTPHAIDSLIIIISVLIMH
jgi:hypothetical protein